MSRVAIVDARLVDGTGRDPVEDAVLVIADGSIEYAGPAAGAPATAGAPVISAGGGTLVPGLIDCHVHLCFDGTPELPDDPPASNAAWTAVKATVNAGRALRAGVTTVRDLGGNGSAVLAVARAKRAGLIEAPAILTAGQIITRPGGHGHSLGRAAGSSEELVAAVRELIGDGADLIKLIATAGALTPGVLTDPPAYRAEEMAAAVDAAHRAGRRVAAHAISAGGVLAALQAGVDSVEHACEVTPDALDLFAQRRTWLVATMIAAVRLARGGPGVATEVAVKAKEIADRHREAFVLAMRAGARIASGTDAGTPLNAHGLLADELDLMHEAGMALPAVLRAATSEAAALLGLAGTGQLTAGFAADVVLLGGDPLAEVAAYRAVRLVMQRGRVVVDRR